MNNTLFASEDMIAMRRLRVAQTIQAIEVAIHESDAPDYFHALVYGLALNLQVEHALVSCFLGPKTWKVRTLGLWISDHFGENYEYGLQDTPCAKVMNGTACFYPSSIQTLFPFDQDLKQLQAQSYLGVPARNAAGQIVGHLVIMDTKALHDKPFLLTTLNFFAVQVGEELGRRP